MFVDGTALPSNVTRAFECSSRNLSPMNHLKLNSANSHVIKRIKTIKFGCLWCLHLGTTVFQTGNNTCLLCIYSSRSSRPEVFCIKVVLRNFTKFTGKHLCQSFFFNKVAGLGHIFPCEFCEIPKNTFFYRIPPVAASIFRLQLRIKSDTILRSIKNCYAENCMLTHLHCKVEDGAL